MRQQTIRRRGTPRATGLSAATLDRLLQPIAVLINAGGIVTGDAKKAFSRALRKAQRRPSARKLERIGYSTAYADIVTRWSRDPAYIDSRGVPLTLPASGKKSLASLVREAAPTLQVSDAISVLQRYGNIARLRSGKYRLVRSFFFAANDKALALEPMAYFLADAGSSFQEILSKNHRSKSPNLFWRKVEVGSLSPASARRFQTFMQHRTLTFLEEVDDWLAAHSTPSHRKSLKRVGLGLFTFQQDDGAA
jgi:hypothetical protein